jgi:hypothetical protein
MVAGFCTPKGNRVQWSSPGCVCCDAARLGLDNPGVSPAQSGLWAETWALEEPEAGRLLGEVAGVKVLDAGCPLLLALQPSP